MGHSDDTFGEYAYFNEDFDTCGSGEPVTYKVSSGNKAIYVTGQYSRFGNGCWSIDVASENEDNLPSWPMSIHFEGYTAVLEISVPDDITLERI